MKKLVLCALLVLSPLACRAADDVTPLNVKIGLWEQTVGMQSPGLSSMSAEMLAKTPPEQRAQVEAAMKKAMNHIVKSCFTADSLKRAQSFQGTADSACKRTIISSSAHSLDFRMECSTTKSKSVGDGHFQSPNQETMRGEINNTTTTPDGRTIVSKTTINSKWVSSDCGTVQPR